MGHECQFCIPRPPQDLICPPCGVKPITYAPTNLPPRCPVKCCQYDPEGGPAFPSPITQPCVDDDDECNDMDDECCCLEYDDEDKTEVGRHYFALTLGIGPDWPPSQKPEKKFGKPAEAPPPTPDKPKTPEKKPEEGKKKGKERKRTSLLARLRQGTPTNTKRPPPKPRVSSAERRKKAVNGGAPPGTAPPIFTPAPPIPKWKKKKIPQPPKPRGPVTVYYDELLRTIPASCYYCI